MLRIQQFAACKNFLFNLFSSAKMLWIHQNCCHKHQKKIENIFITIIKFKKNIITNWIHVEEKSWKLVNRAPLTYLGWV